MTVTGITIVLTLFEDLSVSAHFAFLTNTKLVTKRSNDLILYKILVSIVFVCIIFILLRVWKFKGSKIKFKKSIRGLKSDQKSTGKLTFRVALAALSVLLVYYITMYIFYNGNYTDSYTQGLRPVILTQIFMTNLLPTLWIITTPNMYQSLKIKLKLLKQRCTCTQLSKPKKEQNIQNDPQATNNQGINEGGASSHPIPSLPSNNEFELQNFNSSQESNPEEPEIRISPNSALFVTDENVMKKQNDDMSLESMDSLHVPSPDSQVQEYPISNLIISAVAKIQTNDPIDVGSPKSSLKSTESETLYPIPIVPFNSPIKTIPPQKIFTLKNDNIGMPQIDC